MSETRAPAAPVLLDWKKLRACVHCGLCLHACPTYRELKVETDSPRGRLYLMRALHEGRLSLTDEVRGHLDLCLVCRACETACPSGVQFSGLMEAARAQARPAARRGGLAGWVEDFSFRRVLPGRATLDVLTGLLRVYQISGARALVRGTRVLRLFPRSVQAAEALLPEIPPARSRRKLPALTPAATPEPRKRVALLVTCVMRALYPEVNRATTALLAKAGAEVRVSRVQTCCGALHAHAGRMDEARDLARRNIAAIEALGELDYLVSNAAGCGAALRDYAHWLAGDPDWAPRAAALAGRVRDVTEVLAELELPAPPAPAEAAVAVHDPCHLAHAQGVRGAPRQLLRQAGYQVRELENSDFCCGSAGVYNLTHPDMAGRLLERKLDTVAKAGAAWVAVANPGCLLHMAGGAKRRGLTCEMVHPLVLLARAHGLDLS